MFSAAVCVCAFSDNNNEPKAATVHPPGTDGSLSCDSSTRSVYAAFSAAFSDLALRVCVRLHQIFCPDLAEAFWHFRMLLPYLAAVMLA